MWSALINTRSTEVVIQVTSNKSNSSCWLDMELREVESRREKGPEPDGGSNDPTRRRRRRRNDQKTQSGVLSAANTDNFHPHFHYTSAGLGGGWDGADGAVWRWRWGLPGHFFMLTPWRGNRRPNHAVEPGGTRPRALNLFPDFCLQVDL